MTEMLTLGAVTVVPLLDGYGHLPPSFYPGADFAEHPGLLDATGTYRIRAGAFAVRSPQGVVLIDAGAGDIALPFPPELARADGLTDPPEHLMAAGRLPESLAAAGISPPDVTAVLLTHLHLDHVGWILHDGKPYFPNADVYYGQGDWDLFVRDADPADPARALLTAAHDARILRAYPGEDAEIVPGLRAVHTPGHTPGSYVIELESAGERVYFTGDLIEHPGQLAAADIHFATDVDRSQAQRARAELFAKVRRDHAVIATAHVDAPIFRRITPDGTWAAA